MICQLGPAHGRHKPRPDVQFETTSYDDVSDALADSAAVSKLTDFGMAARLRDGEQFVANVRQGTPFYIAPEVVREHRLHTASDVWAFGVIMWEVMRGCLCYTRGCGSWPQLKLFSSLMSRHVAAARGYGGWCEVNMYSCGAACMRV